MSSTLSACFRRLLHGVPEQRAVDAPEAITAQSPAPVERRWVRRISGGGQIVERCPVWCADHHQNDQDGYLCDIAHGSEAVATELRFHAVGTSGVDDWPILGARLQVEPYAEDPKRHVPHIVLEVGPDEMTEALDPEEFAQVIGQLRGHLDRLEELNARLIAARAEWAEGQR